MRRSVPRRTISRTPLLAPLLALAGVLAACAGTPEGPGVAVEARPARTVSFSDFADPSASAPEVVRVDAPAIVVRSDGLDAAVGAPVLPPNAGTTEERVTIDAVVGQINGAPVYAEEFFRDSERRWREQSRRQSPREWTQELQTYTNNRLFNIVRDELLLAEFRAGLSAPQRQGVLAFVENLREDRIRLAGGSEQGANEVAREEFGVSLDELVKQEAEREFVITQLRQSIGRRVQVSSRDIELYYRRNIRDFQPLPVATIRMISVPTDDPERLRETLAQLAGDDLPEELGSVSQVTLDEAGQRATAFYSNELLDNAIGRLRAGQHTEPLEVGSSYRIVRLEGVTAPEQRGLYDAQLEIEQAIRTERLLEEEQRYFIRLLERSNVSEMNDMLLRLITYASERFWEGPRGEG